MTLKDKQTIKQAVSTIVDLLLAELPTEGVPEATEAPKIEAVEEVKEEKAEEKLPTAEEVKAVLADARLTKGIDIRPIIAKYVPDGEPVKLASVPQSSYRDLLKEVGYAG